MVRQSDNLGYWSLFTCRSRKAGLIRHPNLFHGQTTSLFRHGFFLGTAFFLVATLLLPPIRLCIVSIVYICHWSLPLRLKIQRDLEALMGLPGPTPFAIQRSTILTGLYALTKIVID
uniref:Uncharacterized protein n=2 Tax=Candidatus Kentrum eta TaxID=2126337 RepID=A0A450VFD0_9GAMM|nr:MAG: hypothetical protein BECKH772B_GA0070898_103533 [Candidatus Kentron sp. H]